MEESMARPRNTGGTVYPRKESAFWWVCYRARDGRKIKESSETADREEAERFLRERLAARDEGRLPAILASKNLTFGEWVEWFLEKRSKPPHRSESTHRQNKNAVKLLRPVFGSTRLSEIPAEAVEDYIQAAWGRGGRYTRSSG